MEEYWKTHIIIPPHKDDPPYIVAHIVEKTKKKMYTLNLILFSIAMATIAKLIRMEQRITYEKFEENLTMEENPIRIILENYCGQNVTFTMSSDAEIESSLYIKDSVVTEVHINAYDKDILIEKEDI